MIRPLFSVLIPAIAALLLTHAAAAPYLSPQEAVKAMTVPPGFSVDLIAAEPDIVQPIAFCWDAKGRIWVVEGMTYPTRAKDGEGQDRILIFADEDGDGKFETRKIFAEGLNLVSGIELGYGGVYVGAAPYLMFIADKDGDDKPDAASAEAKKETTVPGLKFHAEILLDGWGYQDTHETLNSFIWGPDGWLYGCHGVFTHSNVGAPGTAEDKRTPINAGYWRFHPVRRVFEIFAHGTSNPWGLDYNEHGDWFSEACVIPHFWHIIQGGYYLRQSNPLGHFNPHVYTNIETIADHQHFIGDTPHAGNGKSDAAGGGHAHCGLCIYNGDNFPAEYRGRPMFFNIHGQRINQENLVPEGSGYVAKHLPDFLLANDPNFSGVALKVGPDGAVYFIDWYDRQKCHLTRKEVWDRSNGRIYRVKFDATWKPWKGDSLAKFVREFTGEESPDSPALSADERRGALLGALGLIAFLEDKNGWLQRKALQMTREQAVPPLSTSTFERWHGHFEGSHAPVGEYQMMQTTGVLSWLRSHPKGRKEAENWLKFALYPKAGNVEPGEQLFMPGYENSVSERHRFWMDVVSEIWSNPGDTETTSARQMVYSMLQMFARAGTDQRTRLTLASALQRLPQSERWPLLEALLAHEEDAKDHNLPQMYWYAVEPLVPAEPERALALAEKSKIPLVSQNIARRLSSVDGGVAHLVTAMGKEKTAAGLVYLLKAARDGMRGRTMAAPESWEGAWKNMDDVLARRPDAKDHGPAVLDLRDALAVAFGDKRAFPGLRKAALDSTLPVERRQNALQTLVMGSDPELGDLLLKLLDDPAMRLAALRAIPSVK